MSEAVALTSLFVFTSPTRRQAVRILDANADVLRCIRGQRSVNILIACA